MPEIGICEKCGKRRILKRNHLDGNQNNNALSNIEWWCDECHAKYHQYPKGKNNGVQINRET